MNNKCVIYLGNGYDVAWGFKTKYCQFIESTIFKELKSTCNLAKWVDDKYSEDKNRWSDLEEMLFIYSNYLRNLYKDSHEFRNATDMFKEEHRRLTITLQKYIAEQLHSSSGSVYMRKLEDSWKSSFEIKCICCFNYSANAVYSKLIDGYNKLNRIHGELQPRGNYTEVQVKLGIDRSMKVCPEHGFLYKDKMPTYSYGIWSEPNKRLIAAGKIVKPAVTTFHPEFHDVDSIIIYGCSIGESDTAYFKYLFDNAKGKKIILYYYMDAEKVKIMKRIREISKYPVEDILFIDSAKDGGFRKDFSTLIKRGV
ncbi:MAG: hypothetical protein IKM85_09630 [Bacteroidales bacterium]|nr:hypothetical protein [Bacteroidales bacterium]